MKLVRYAIQNEVPRVKTNHSCTSSDSDSVTSHILPSNVQRLQLRTCSKDYKPGGLHSWAKHERQAQWAMYFTASAAKYHQVHEMPRSSKSYLR
eukprot:2421036-Amphidinium_carterae.1